MIVYNTTPRPIFIVVDWREDPLGGMATQETTYCLASGDAMDLEIVGLKTKEELEKK